jgi:hypothetical protein
VRIAVIFSYLLIATASPAFLALFPLFCFTSVEHGGLGLGQAAIGNTLAFRGIATIFVQLFVFARMQNKYGSAKSMRVVSSFFTVQFALYPVIRWCATRSMDGTVVFLLGIMMLLWASANMSWRCVYFRRVGCN